jgi:hypothetical protein
VQRISRMSRFRSSARADNLLAAAKSLAILVSCDVSGLLAPRLWWLDFWVGSGAIRASRREFVGRVLRRPGPRHELVETKRQAKD